MKDAGGWPPTVAAWTRGGLQAQESYAASGSDTDFDTAYYRLALAARLALGTAVHLACVSNLAGLWWARYGRTHDPSALVSAIAAMREVKPEETDLCSAAANPADQVVGYLVNLELLTHAQHQHSPTGPHRDDLREMYLQCRRLLDPARIGSTEPVTALINAIESARQGADDPARIEGIAELTDCFAAALPSESPGRLTMTDRTAAYWNHLHLHHAHAAGPARALAALDRALIGLPVGHHARVRYVRLTALSRLDEYGRTPDAATLDRLIADIESVDPTGDPSGNADLVRMLAFALGSRAAFTGQRADLERAISIADAALSQPDVDVDERSGLASVLAVFLTEWLEHRQPDDLPANPDRRDRAVEAFHEALSAPAVAPDLLRSAVTFGRYLLRPAHALPNRGEYSREVEAAAALLSAASARARELTDGVGAAALTMECARSWADAAMLGAKPNEAIEAFRIARRAADVVVNAPDANDAQVRAASELTVQAAVGFLKCDTVDEAVDSIEHGRARVLQRALGRPVRATEPVEDSAAPAGTSVVYLCTDGTDAYGLLVTEDGTRSAIRLGDTANRLESVVQGYFAAQVGPDPAGWRRALTATTGWLWDCFLGPLLPHVDPRRQLVLIPTGKLALLPVHAAATPDQDRPTRTAYALDHATITLAPTLRLINAAHRSVAGTTVRSVVTADSPGPGSGPPLRHTRTETARAVDHFGVHASLRGTEVSRESILVQLRYHSVAHLALHGYTDPYDLGGSALLLAAGEQLTLQDIAGHELPSSRLVVLSACETAASSLQLPGEPFGLPAAFMHAGAGGVIGSLWRVPDHSTMLLMTRFYELWRVEQLSPPEALRRAQLWLRDSTNAEKHERYPALTQAGPDTPSARRHWRELRSHAHPVHWAGFVYTGA